VIPLVVFALRPEPGYFAAKMLDPWNLGEDPLSPAWYKCLRLGNRFVTNETDYQWHLVASTIVDVGRSCIWMFGFTKPSGVYHG